MLHHMVLFKMKSDISAADKESFLPTCIEELKKIPFGTNAAMGPPVSDKFAQGYEYGLYRQFNSMDEFLQYRVHPDHQALLQGIVKERVENMISYQIEG